MASPFLFFGRADYGALRVRVSAPATPAEAADSLRTLPREPRTCPRRPRRVRWNPELVLPRCGARFESRYAFHSRLRHTDVTQSARDAGRFGCFLPPEIAQIGFTGPRAHHADARDANTAPRERLNELLGPHPLRLAAHVDVYHRDRPRDRRGLRHRCFRGTSARDFRPRHFLPDERQRHLIV